MEAAPTLAELYLFLFAGLLGGAHCLGMCGPLVSIYSDRMNVPGGSVTWVAIRQHLLFGLGRSVSYAALGGLLGGLGGGFDRLSRGLPLLHGVRGTVGLIVGVFILMAGGTYLLRGTPLGRSATGWLPRWVNPVPILLNRVESWVNGGGMLALGSLHVLLPCPILYPAFAYCLARAGSFRGALLMGALGVGTVPTLFVYGLVHQSLPAILRRGMHRVLGGVFALLGLVTVSMALRTYGLDLPIPMIPYTSPIP